ncbi:MAG: FAD-dependent oxidoreductase [Acidobacteria bacterium]|nr:FAD-dependent oxidoreductase [Acidobacteriota bacterium]
MNAFRTVIVGGGLAGMTAAHELVRQGMEVILIEAGPRLGGKAGADRFGDDYQEHGNHFFPAWYLNTRRLMDELGILGNLVDMTRLHQLRRGLYPHYQTLLLPTRLSCIPRNIFAAGHLPWSDSALLVFSFLDLACQGHCDDAELDDLSLDRFLATRSYGDSRVRRGADAMLVESIATPAGRFSASTMQSIVRCWLRYRVPMYSVLNADLQRGLIDPFERTLRALGCRIELDTRVDGLVRSGRSHGQARIDGVRASGKVIRGDVFVSALPSGVLSRIMDPELLEDARISGVTRLESVPMGAMTVYLRRPIAGLPPEHVILAESRYALSFIDVSQTWGGCPGSVLTLNIGDVASLIPLPHDQAAECVIDELRSFVSEIRATDVDRHHLRLNTDTPLLANSIGSWRHRATAGHTAIPNLFLAGDHCRSGVNVTSMEGAVASGLSVARAILAERGLPARREVLEPVPPPLGLLRGFRALLLPGMHLLGAWRQMRGAR